MERLHSFDDVVRRYESVKPVVSKHHDLAADVRPIGDRARKWERIKKIDDATYALLDGNYGHTMWGHYKAGDDTLYENAMAPIVWTREADGDYIRIRNHREGNSGVSRYDFLWQNLPRGMAFSFSNGKQFISAVTAPGNPETFPLPKCDVEFDYGTHKMVRDDNVFLKFRVEGNALYTRVSEKLKVVSTRIDSMEKKLWRERIDGFYEYMRIFGPMIQVDWEAKRVYREAIVSWCKDHKIAFKSMWGAPNVPPEVMRQVFTQEDHTLRVAVACLILDHIDAKTENVAPNKVRAAYNRLINKSLSLYKIEER